MNVYTTVQGDTWDIISNKVYDSYDFYDDLINSNEKYSDVVFFQAGIELEVPEIETSTSDTLPPWR
ncbi:tail protein X [Ilyobacter polytropus]|uniref:Tail X family protein n=1 Tax=Ilyobacter polytropus (strain ATCC 51220 / DSM 2926 / LMG 16218 / CuHBu1) TaxID=572544 RepID=E3HBL1_ILYPC|nr:tail protein X [Ilyobacter polytropus]ADO83707.1 tail X family protein [Ilyobacter polytropus DSM 2926]